jgi:hypothetical protein
MTPPGTGFMPKETAEHHRGKILVLIHYALEEAKMTLNDILYFVTLKVQAWLNLLVLEQICVELLHNCIKNQLLEWITVLGILKWEELLPKLKTRPYFMLVEEILK